ncbi:serine O-acetyltransferase EpsC [Methanobacterium sp. BAmetb5]|uniref:serine O-acetyltransferase EpsC n=1 Tax=Methanobacterium sp. BAmetb5 TaxID=2025351 RepID=UPI000E92C9AC|nr:serine O-acetyltransferase EpsC [Methanobacterium sp. BAmetb5]AXV38915.1 MAG: hypothetical protein CIT02_00610 [Methanobacterium sp. BAmetb5]
MNKKKIFTSLLVKDISRFRKVDTNIYLLILRYFITSSAFRSMFFHRLLSLNLVNNKVLRKIITAFGWLLTEIEIPSTSNVGGGLFIPHPKCIIINRRCIIGENVTIAQGVTIGGNIFKEKNGRESPIIENNVLIGAGAKILGPVTVGENSIIGANAVVIKDIPKNSVAVGIPAKVVKQVNEPYPDLIKKNYSL